MDKKSLYNTEGVDSLDETLIGGNPSGLLNFNRTRYKWATSLYKTMRDCFWTPESVDTSDEGKRYSKLLSEDEQRAYDRVFARLSFLDSLVADSLMDNLNGYITNKIVNACLIEQAAQEILHSKSYAVLLADAVEDSDSVFNLYKTDLALNAINTEVHDMFRALTNGPVTDDKIFYAMIANQILEGILFQTGFATIYYLGDRMLASASMIAEIHKDENNHVALFENMIREFHKENPDLPWFLIRANVNKMFDAAYKLESSWMQYVLGFKFDKEITDQTVAYFVKKRASKIGMYDHEEDKYGFGKVTPLVRALEARANGNDTRSNFFEAKVTTYSKQELNFTDDFTDFDERDHLNAAKSITVEESREEYRRMMKKEKGHDKHEVVDRSDECIGCQ